MIKMVIFKSNLIPEISKIQVSLVEIHRGGGAQGASGISGISQLSNGLSVTPGSFKGQPTEVKHEGRIAEFHGVLVGLQCLCLSLAVTMKYSEVRQPWQISWVPTSHMPGFTQQPR